MSEPTERPAFVVTPKKNQRPIATLGNSVVLYCRVVGWPKPQITWWRGNSMLPRSSKKFEQYREGSLSIKRVSLFDLGPYTCQAYNGKGTATSHIIVLKALGPLKITSSRDRAFLKYIVSPPKPPPTTPSPPKTKKPYFPAYRPDERPYWPSYRTTTTSTTSRPNVIGKRIIMLVKKSY